MKKILIILLFIPFALSAQVQPIPADADYFVAPWGNDSNSGQDTTHSWKTWQKGFTTAQPGDHVYIRGGVYYPSTPASGNNIIYWNPEDNVGHDGQPGSPICIYNYPGETPILDCKKVHAPGVSPNNRYLTGIMMYDVSWVNWRGLIIRNVYQHDANVDVKGICGQPVSNMNFDRITVHNIGGVGFQLSSWVNQVVEDGGWDETGYIPYDTTAYINCDVYNCCDTLPANTGNDPGNMGDGFKHMNYPGAYITYTGCRAWNNADDGWDCGGASIFIWDNCWGFYNGHFETNVLTQGNGIKTGGTSEDMTFPSKIVRNCILAFNKEEGLFELGYGSYHRSMGRYYNNTIYKNGKGITISENPTYPIINSAFYNNIIYGTVYKDAGGRPYNLDVNEPYIESHNTWDYAESGSLPNWTTTDTVTVTDDDFVEIDSATIISQLTAARQSDGSLPVITALHLAEGSDLINTGIGLGITTDGDNRLFDDDTISLGAFQYASKELPEALPPTVTTVSPTIQNSRLVTANGNVTSSGGATVTERGICYGTSENPTISNSKVIKAGTTGAFSVPLYLNSNTNYHARAYATNETGTAYGSDVSFTTPAQSAVTGSGGKAYVLNGIPVILK